MILRRKVTVALWSTRDAPRRRMIEDMTPLHITEAELARDVHAVLDKVRQGAEIIIEQNNSPVAILRPALPPRRKISEVLALVPENSKATMDESFARDVQASIESHREPLDGSAWD
jgi:antitoxin (DNA-binding transcriptional repressor) of toxin-antitoxin stability system